MISYETYRTISEYPHLLSSLQFSVTRGGSTSTSYVSVSNVTSYSDGVSATTAQSTTLNTQSFVTDSQTATASFISEVGGTTSANATMLRASSSSSSSLFQSAVFNTSTLHTTATSSASSSSAHSSSTTFNIPDVIIVTTRSSTDYDKTVSTTDTTDTTHYIVSAKSLATETTTANITTTTDTTSTSSLLSTTTQATTWTTNIERGTVLISDSDWLWIASTNGTAPSFLTDFATSIGTTTIWADRVIVSRSFATATNNGAAFSTLAIAGNSREHSYQFLLTTSTETTLTSGDLFSRDTFTTTAVNGGSTSSFSFSDGDNAQTITALSTVSFALSTSAYSSTVLTKLYLTDGFGYSTTRLSSITQLFSTSSSYSSLPTVLASFSSVATFGSDDFGTTSSALTVERGDLSFRNYRLVPFGEKASALAPVAPFGCFVAPGSSAFGSNLSFQHGQIPYGEVRSVFPGVGVPYPISFSTTDGDSHTFRFSWSSDTLKVTVLDGSSTVTHTSTSEGTFSTVGSLSSYFEEGGSIFGGFQPIESASESVTFFPRAVAGTSIFPGGSSTTYRSLVTSSEESTIQGTLIVETSTPAYRVWTYLASEQLENAPYLVFSRN